MTIPKELHNEVATISKDITNPSFGGVLRHQDDTLITRGGGRGLQIYDDIERDCHAFAVLQKRKAGVIGREWTVAPASNSHLDKRAADLVRTQLAGLSGDIPDDEVLPQVTGFDAACLNLLDAILKGFAVGEIMWSTDGVEIVATEIRARDQRRFDFIPGTRGYKLALKTYEHYLPGEPVPPRKFVVNTFGSKVGNPYGLGLGSRLFWPTMFKRQGITFWLQFVDKFAAPTAKGTYPTGASPEEKTKLLDALQAISQDAGIIVPDGMTIELIEAARSGSIDCYESLARYMDEQISEAVLGETGSTNQSNGGGSRARDQVGNSVRLELVKADSDLLCGCLNGTLIKWITALNVPGATPPKVWRNCDEEENLKLKAERDGILSREVGVKFSQTYIKREYGLEDGDIESVGINPPNPPLTKGGSKAPPFVKGGGGGISFAETDQFTPEQQALEVLADRAIRAAAATLHSNEQLIIAAVQSATSYEDAIQRVLEVYPDMNIDRLAALMESCVVGATGFGRYTVEQEADA